MFNRRCDNEQPHTLHVYSQHWKKAELPFLPVEMADLPEEWDVTYKCKGIEPFEAPTEVQAALDTYAAHIWNSYARLCACGDTFEASTTGRIMHEQHRMTATLSAAAAVGIFCDQCSGPYTDIPWLMAQYGGHWDTCPNRAFAGLVMADHSFIPFQDADGAIVCAHITGPGGTGAPPEICGHRAPVRVFTDVELNRLAQYLYEAIGDSPEMVLQMAMTAKPALVDALKTSLERIQ